LLTVEESIGKKQRKLIQPAFHKGLLLVDTIQKNHFSRIKNIKTGKPMDVFPVFNDLAFQTVIKSIFNINISGADIDSLQHTTEATQKCWFKTTFFVWWFNLSGKRKAFRLDSRELKNAQRHMTTFFCHLYIIIEQPKC
jgi:cytochrome P450